MTVIFVGRPDRVITAINTFINVRSTSLLCIIIQSHKYPVYRVCFNLNYFLVEKGQLISVLSHGFAPGPRVFPFSP